MAKPQPIRQIREELEEAAEATVLESSKTSTTQQHQYDNRGPDWHKIEAEKAKQQMRPSDL